ncbi:FkbM family methyltransferase [Methylobacterium sp. 391_Methyba4]|uniref:FkbM family methyltransferase n=1 Tax=Methylobacterium sp. 391_Methyba4 TaxID=3038924 RepID=UPI00241C1618|nr:FkbM family methyltransferase [Methylobacterium sp. 391_Methyba4]WFS09109.1 FkbM family methyltransferase [Methylobacterium sp. 391_Methyba4]
MHEIARSVLPGELVFDIGAHAGSKAQWFADRGARVIAVEPQPAMIEKLRVRFDGNPNVTVVPKGLAGEPGELTMRINTQAPTISTFTEHWTKGRFSDMVWDDQAIVQVTTLDQLVSEYGAPRYTKIDVEGFEKSVMLGLTRRIGAISFEFTTEFEAEARDIMWYARGLGYRHFNFSLGEAEEYALADWADVETAIAHLKGACAADSDAWGDVYVSA